MAIESINPATEEVMQRFAEASGVQVEAALEASMAAFRDWRKTSFEHRAGLMRRRGPATREAPPWAPGDAGDGQADYGLSADQHSSGRAVIIYITMLSSCHNY